MFFFSRGRVIGTLCVCVCKIHGESRPTHTSRRKSITQVVIEKYFTVITIEGRLATRFVFSGPAFGDVVAPLVDGQTRTVVTRKLVALAVL